MRNQENTGIIVRGKHVVTNLLLFTKYLLSVNSSFIKESKRDIRIITFLTARQKFVYTLYQQS